MVVKPIVTTEKFGGGDGEGVFREFCDHLVIDVERLDHDRSTKPHLFGGDDLQVESNSIDEEIELREERPASFVDQDLGFFHRDLIIGLRILRA